ncbi:hypothetical protein HPB47_003421 [Ixodes persulcatus]|uniref:Uncharacterized protein n=1 Tax=Ixodes persulcatus TaxID=34615 RepID=A0AC60PIG6_IXOPE|nr:hypothetical protein HPB47_003421 [Ixodes persulcatus]
MDTAAALTSGTRGQQAEVKTQQQLEPARTTAIDLDAGLLGKLGITKEDIGKLITTLFHSYIQGTLTPGWMASQQRNAMESQEVSSQDTSQFPSLQKLQKPENATSEERQAKPNSLGTALSEESPEDEGFEMYISKRRRKRRCSTVQKPRTSSEEDRRENPKSTQTVVLKAICKKNVKDFKTRDIKTAVEKTGIASPDDYKIQIQPKTNTIALTTRNEEIIENLLKVTDITKDEDSYALSPYKAMGNDQVRGVIYLHGDNSDETPETLLPDLECRTAKVVYARLMGKKGNAVVITFEGTWLPKKVMFCREVFTVKPYRPRPIGCFSCHNIGHKTDVCPSKESRCDQCGHIHEEEMEECTRDPQCKNCGGAHVATTAEATERKLRGSSQSNCHLTGPTSRPTKHTAGGHSNPPNPGKPTVDSNEKMAAPNWIPEWAQRTKAKSTEQPDWRKEVQALEARFEKQESKIAKFEKDVEMGFNMVFQVLGEIKKEIAELKHSR